MATTEETTPDLETSETDGHEDLVEVNGEKVSLEELKKGYMRQSDYTRKTQELSKKKQEESSTIDDEDEAAKRYLDSFLKEKGVLTREELEKERKLDSLLGTNPELKPYGEAIKKLADSENLAFEDVIEKYNFASKDKLEKAKTRGIMGDKETKPKSVSDMTEKEREDFKARYRSGSNVEEVGTI